MDKRFWAVIGVIVIFFVGFVVFRGGSDNTSDTTAAATNHQKGNGTAITLIEYGDFQCPACGQYYPVLEQLIDKYDSDMKFQFRHFPLISIHPNGFASSRAAEAASKQGKFWEMYERLYAGQNDWSNVDNPNSIFEAYATSIGLNIEQYKSDFASKPVNDAINADLREGRKLNVQATPTFVINGKVIQTPPASLEAFSKIIDDELAKQQ